MGVKLFEGSLDERATIRKAATGTTGVLWNLPTMIKDLSTDWPRQTQTVLQAAREAGTVTTIVFSTAFYTGRHPEWDAKNPGYVSATYYDAKYRCEQLVLKSGFPHITILRPSWLMNNYIAPYSSFHFPELATERKLATAFGPETRMPNMSAGDVGKFVAAAFLSPEKFSGKQIELGSGDLTIAEVAATVSRVTGVDVKVKYRNSEEVKEAASTVLTQQFQIMAMEEDMTIDPSSLDEYGIKLTSLEEYLMTEKEALKIALGLTDPLVS
jgi:uncharacterized protein YbjT (DUF2867 family)